MESPSTPKEVAKSKGFSSGTLVWDIEASKAAEIVGHNGGKATNPSVKLKYVDGGSGYRVISKLEIQAPKPSSNLLQANQAISSLGGEKKELKEATTAKKAKTAQVTKPKDSSHSFSFQTESDDDYDDDFKVSSATEFSQKPAELIFHTPISYCGDEIEEESEEELDGAFINDEIIKDSAPQIEPVVIDRLISLIKSMGLTTEQREFISKSITECNKS
mmetsp:Transcript_8065/g.10002  ORF Transcript_8065/g.10002 Transcript_8065/m.10002 type:complete len:218 (-) Transcript_8065:39-692(-)